MLVLMKQRVDPRKCAIIIGPVGTSGKGIVRSFVFDSTVVHVKSMANFSVVLLGVPAKIRYLYIEVLVCIYRSALT
jgi:hypothetical protein